MERVHLKSPSDAAPTRRVHDEYMTERTPLTCLICVGKRSQSRKVHDVVGGGRLMCYPWPFANASPCRVSSHFGITRCFMLFREERCAFWIFLGHTAWNHGMSWVCCFVPCRARLHETCSGLVHWFQGLPAMPLHRIESANLMRTTATLKNLKRSAVLISVYCCRSRKWLVQLKHTRISGKSKPN